MEKLFNSLIEHYHYLGYCHPVGEQLKYIVFAGERPVACMAWSSAPRHIGVRDWVRLSDCFLKTGRGFIIILFITLRHLLIKIDLPGPAIKLPTGFIGDTTGRGKNDQTNKPNRSIKAVLGYPLSKNFRTLLTGGMQ